MAPKHDKALKQPEPPQTSVAASMLPEGLSEAAKRWLEENQEAIRSSNEYVEKHGLPLAKYRAFQWRD